MKKSVITIAVLAVMGTFAAGAYAPPQEPDPCSGKPYSCRLATLNEMIKYKKIIICGGSLC